MRRKKTKAQPSRSVPAMATWPPTNDSKAAASDSWKNLRRVLICLVLVIVVLVAYGSLFGRDVEFFNLDDGDYVYANPEVRAGLTGESIRWAFTTFHAANWHPLTWLSLQIDHEFYGLAPGGFHFTNVLLHAASAVLLLFALESMTKDFWPSAFVAALFALHPSHVESVAWIAERKDVLSGLFWMLTLVAYAWYAERPSLGRYMLVVASFVLGLMAKPMLVTLPCVMLLLDYWPLRRWRSRRPAANDSRSLPPGEFATASLKCLLLEKAPLLAIAAAASAITTLAQNIGQTPELGQLPLLQRLLGAAIAVLSYLVQTFWPIGLAPLYTSPRNAFSNFNGLAAAALLVILTIVLLLLGRRRNYLTVGWLWFLGTLVPVLGIVQIGIHTMADRYTYIPQIGLFIIIAWGARDVFMRHLSARMLAITGGGVLLTCFTFTLMQAQLWRSNVLLWEHAVAVTTDNFGAHDHLAEALVDKGRIADALPHYRRAVELEPRYLRTYMHMGQALQRLEKWDQAADCYRALLHLEPKGIRAEYELGYCLMNMGQMEEALVPLTSVVEAQPELAEAHVNLGTALLHRGRYDAAAREASAALKLAPELPEARQLQGLIDAVLGKPMEAERHFREALQSASTSGDLDPIAAYGVAWSLEAQGKTALAQAQYGLATQRFPKWPAYALREAWTLATNPDALRRNGALALVKAQMAVQAMPGDAHALDVLAAAYAEQARFPEAVASLRQAQQLSPKSASQESQRALADAMAKRLELYQKGQPFRQAPAS